MQNIAQSLWPKRNNRDWAIATLLTRPWPGSNPTRRQLRSHFGRWHAGFNAIGRFKPFGPYKARATSRSLGSLNRRRRVLIYISLAAFDFSGFLDPPCVHARGNRL